MTTTEKSAWGEASVPHLNTPDTEFNSEGDIPGETYC